MNHDDLLELVTAKLDRPGDSTRWSEQPGAVLFSDIASIRPGDFYLMGINPGRQEKVAIRENLYAPEGTNHYADQCWECSSKPCEHLDPAERLRPEFRSKFQRRVCTLIDSLGLAPHEMLSTNAIFRSSPNINELPQRWEWWQRCWEVHEQLLRVVKPSWIISMGYGSDDAYTWLKPQRSYPEKQVAAKAWHYTREMNFGAGPQPVDVLGVSHPSKGADYGDDLKDFIATHVRPSRPRAA